MFCYLLKISTKPKKTSTTRAKRKTITLIGFLYQLYNHNFKLYTKIKNHTLKLYTMKTNSTTIMVKKYMYSLV